jgi:hypothetical protein
MSSSTSRQAPDVSWVPYYRVVTDDFKEIKGLFRGKIVLIGATSEVSTTSSRRPSLAPAHAGRRDPRQRARDVHQR